MSPKKTPWHKVEMTAPAVIGVLVMVVGPFFAGPWAIVVGFVAMVLLAAYRIATRD